MWPEDKDNEDGRHRKGPMHISAPRIALPGHEESYRPPEEYLFTEVSLQLLRIKSLLNTRQEAS